MRGRGGGVRSSTLRSYCTDWGLTVTLGEFSHVLLEWFAVRFIIHAGVQSVNFCQ